MIKSIGGGNGIQINNSYSNWPSFYGGSGQLGVGDMRYNGSTQCVEVYDGGAWLTLTPTHPSIELNGAASVAIDWVLRKMAEEARLEQLAKKSPAVAEAIAAVKKAEEQVMIVAALVDTQ